MTQDLDFLLENPVKVSRPADVGLILAKYGMEEVRSIPVRVPEPVVFVLMKYLLTIKRTGSFESKITKDISTARDLEVFLMETGAGVDFRDRF